MQCQREPAPSRRVRLTDQALVAVTLARAAAAAHDRPATSVHLLVGLGAEPDGAAGRVLRRRSGALTALVERSAAPPPGLAGLQQVVAAAADRAGPRPPATSDLLAAAIVVGGEDLDALLARCGYAPGDLWERGPRAPEGEAIHGDAGLALRIDGDAGETLTLQDPQAPPLTSEAARAVGRVRALAGGAVDLVIALADDPAVDLVDLIGDVDPLRLRAARHDLGGVPAARSAAWDAGLDAVLEAAGVLAADRPVAATDLLQAALVAGGSGPLAVLDGGRRPRATGGSP